MSNDSPAEKIVAGLEQMRVRPALWLGGIDHARTMFTGLEMAYRFLYNASPPFSMRIAVLNAHGWDCGPQAGLPFIKASALSDSEQLLEYLNIEIEVWKLFAAQQQLASGE